MNLVALHGFWGSPREYHRFLACLRPDHVWVPNLFEKGSLDPSHSFSEWTNNFIRELQERFVGPIHLVGYSQGARLALHALIANPDLFCRTLLLSCHPGQLDATERLARLKWIQTWRVKFLEGDWEDLVHEWNSQEVFLGDAAEGKERLNREFLSQALENWSVLGHGFGWQDLRQLPGSVCWAFGARDLKFLTVKENLQRQAVKGEIVLMENAGHRILTDQPEVAARLVRKDASYGQ